MKFIHITGAILTAAVALFTTEAAAQTVIDLRFTQNPLFEVSTNSVAAAMPADGNPLILGGDLTIAGGSGTYTYLWTDASGDKLGDEATLTVSIPGTYILNVTDQCDCLQQVTFSIEAAGIDATAVADVRIFTNGSDLLIEGTEAVQVSVFTPSGAMAALFTPAVPASEFSLDTLEPGVYLIQILTSDDRLLIYKTQI